MSSLPRKWTQEEDDFLRSNYFTLTRFEIAEKLGRTHPSVRKRCSSLCLNQKHPAWTDADTARILAWYAEKPANDLRLDELSVQMGRTKAFICRKARALGLTVVGRALSPASCKTIGTTAKARIAKNGHPRGALGMKHSPESLRKMSVSGKKAWASKTQTEIDARTDKAQATCMKNHGCLNPGAKYASNPYSRTKSGKREDLGGLFFRSAWEANYARYLNFLIERGQIQKWEFEPETFWFEKIKRGVRSYMPDFKIYRLDETSYFVEVKGWMDDKSKTKIKRMAIYHPKIELIVFDKTDYAKLKKQFAGVLPFWE